MSGASIGSGARRSAQIQHGPWDDYQLAYEEAIRATATSDAPWYVVPADNKWYSRLIVVAAMNHELRELNLEYPKVSDKQRAALNTARAKLEAEG